MLFSYKYKVPFLDWWCISLFNHHRSKSKGTGTEAKGLCARLCLRFSRSKGPASPWV